EYNEDQQRPGQRPENSPGKRLERRTDQRLDTWKEIGAFFGRDERTVKRWEDQRGLPVHRVPGSGRGSVYAYTNELAEWLKTADTRVSVSTSVEETTSAAAALDAPVATDSSDLPEVLAAETPDLPKKSRSAWMWIAAALAIVALVGGLWLYKTRWAGEPKTSADAHPVDPQAQELYLKGIYYWHKRTPEGLTQAVDYFTQSIVRDPNYAPAYVGLADCYNLLREYTKMPPEEAYPQAKAAAERAIALDDSLSGAHSSLAFVDFYWSWDSASAEREFKRAIELDPNSVVAHHWYATFLMHMGRFKEALEQIEIAQKLDPSSISALADKGAILEYITGRDDAIKLEKELETSDPNFLSPHNYLAGMYFRQHDYSAAIHEAKKYAELMKDDWLLSVAQAAEKGFAAGGREDMLKAMRAEQQRLYSEGKYSAYLVAGTAAQLGDKRTAMKYLQEALSKHDERMIAIRIDENFAAYRSDPAFQKLVEQVGLPAYP
ncbi:MAG: tetratricopeptide repeat protein, partial [Candidatus Acidiferrales bacterium]